MNVVGAGGEESNLTPNGSIHIPYIPAGSRWAEIPQFPIYFPRQRRCQAMEHFHGFALPLSSTPA